MLKKQLTRAATAALVITGRLVSPKAAMRLAGGLARRFKLDPKINKRRLRENLRTCFPGREAEWIERTARELQANAARARIIDKHFVPRLSGAELDALVEVVGGEHLERAREEKRGVVALGLHFGRYWCFPAWATQHGYVTTAFQSSDGKLPGADRMLSGGSFSANDPRATVRAVKALKKGAICFLIADAGKVANPVTIDFAGQPTRLSTAAIRLAKAADAYVLPLITPIHPNDPDRVRVVLFDPIDSREVPAGESVEATMARIVAPFEDFVRSRPEQWYGLLNVHRRIAENGGDAA